MHLEGLIMLTVATLWAPGAALAASTPHEAAALHNANITHAVKRDYKNAKGFSSLFSPRMDFEQWKPLTGRGDPLRNDPTYDYEPPVLERVHYWADETRYEREHYPERKSEVLMLGVSSRRPSVGHGSLPPPRRPHHPPSPPPKYDKYSYKLSDRYPMTILVPPPPPPPGHIPTLFALDDKPPLPTSQVRFTDNPTIPTKDTTPQTEHIPSSYALQEANLIYQSSSTSQNWINQNQTNSFLNHPVSSDYAGWGPTTPLDENETNDTHNFIFKDHNDYMNHPYLFYKPMLSEAPSPPARIPIPFNTPINTHTFLPTTVSITPTAAVSPVTTESPSQPPDSTSTIVTYDEEETITEKQIVSPTISPTSTKSDSNIFDMMTSMLSMPLLNGSERPEDNLYAHASENLHVYKEQSTESVNDETMQTMQPPPPSTVSETSTYSHKKRPYHVNAHLVNHLAHKPMIHDPYLHLRHTTPKPKTTVFSSGANPEGTTELAPSYLIIQGHSKVKTYGSNPNDPKNNTVTDAGPNPNETKEVKHLHPIKDKHAKKTEKPLANRLGRVQNLQTLVDRALGSIEIQETDVGIKYDVSDGGDVPIEIYRKGIVETDENNYFKSKKERRRKRQLSLEDFVPFDEDTLEEYVYNFLKSKRNATGITGIIAQAVTGNATSIIDALEDDEDDEEDDR